MVHFNPEPTHLDPNASFIPAFEQFKIKKFIARRFYQALDRRGYVYFDPI